MERRKELLFRLLWWAAATGVGWLALRYALVWLLPFLLALGAAALLEPLIETARRRLHLRRSFTAAVLTLVLVGGVLAVLIVLAVQVVEQAVALVSSLPELLAALPDTLTSLERRLESFCAACPEGVGRAARGLRPPCRRRRRGWRDRYPPPCCRRRGAPWARCPRSCWPVAPRCWRCSSPSAPTRQ